MKGRLLSALLGSLVTATVLSAGGLGAAPYDVLRPLLGAGLVRAEIVTRSAGTLHDYRVDKGRIRQVKPAELTLRELDGTMVSIQIAPTAQIRLGGRTVGYAQLRRGMHAIVIRDGDAPANRVVATLR